jgi:CRP/FNR family transcriptional regulator, dissimilatory nitrate respiration regulator
MELTPARFRVAMIVETLRRCPLFGGLPADTLEKIAEGSDLRSIPRGGYVFRESEPMDACYVVHTGAVNVHRVLADGREQIIRVFYPGESFAEIGLAQTDGFPADAVAVEDSQVIRVRRDRFRAWIQEDPELALRILASMSLHLKHLVELLEDVKYKHAEARLSGWLCRQAVPDPAGGSGYLVEIPTTKRLLAGQLGLASETLSRVLARLRDEGIITIDGRRILINDRDRLLPDGR